MPAISLLTTEKTISSAISSIARRGNNLDLSIWIAGASAIAHAKEHGDLTLFGKLCNAMPKGSRVMTLIAWAQSAAPIAVAKDKDGLFTCKVDKKREGFESDRSDWDVGFLAETAWYTYKKAPEFKSFGLDDLVKYLEKVVDAEDTPVKEITAEARAFAALSLKAIEHGQAMLADKAPAAKVADMAAAA